MFNLPCVNHIKENLFTNVEVSIQLSFFKCTNRNRSDRQANVQYPCKKTLTFEDAYIKNDSLKRECIRRTHMNENLNLKCKGLVRKFKSLVCLRKTSILCLDSCSILTPEVELHFSLKWCCFKSLKIDLFQCIKDLLLAIIISTTLCYYIL